MMALPVVELAVAPTAWGGARLEITIHMSPRFARKLAAICLLVGARLQATDVAAAIDHDVSNGKGIQ